MDLTSRATRIFGLAVLSLVVPAAGALAAPAPRTDLKVEKTNTTLGVIRGVVRGEDGSPIADATVAIFRTGTSKLLKQVSSAADGSFIAKILPGTYTVLAVAQGFNPTTLFAVEIGKAAEVTYGFKLERAGSGNTLPEKKLDRSSSKWRIRAMQSQRSIYQHREGTVPVVGAEDTDEEAATSDDGRTSRKGQTVVETYFASGKSGNFSGVNFATLVPISDGADIVFAGQAARGRSAPQRFETSLKFRPAADHQLRVNSSVSRLGKLNDKALGQFSVQATDEWTLKDGVILVLGFDYSRFTGAGGDSSVSPRLGLQFDVDPRTRVRAAFTSQTEERSWAHAIDLEDRSVAFAEPMSVEDLFVANGKPRMNKSSRLELGVERLLDNSSSIEANGFFDMTLGRGVGLNTFPIDTLDGTGFGDIVANQQGRSMGFRLVYSRRINGTLTAHAGYAFGKGQRISENAIQNPSDVFESDFFHSFFAELAAGFKTGTNVKTVLRLSPEATVFAIDPFQGRLAIYDPGMSVVVTQSLPTLGLPIHAEAIVDARNLFDFQAGAFSDDGGIRANFQRRMLRGGIQVRF